VQRTREVDQAQAGPIEVIGLPRAKQKSLTLLRSGLPVSSGEFSTSPGQSARFLDKSLGGVRG
jgi:hypothetical protein